MKKQRGRGNKKNNNKSSSSSKTPVSSDVTPSLWPISSISLFLKDILLQIQILVITACSHCVTKTKTFFLFVLAMIVMNPPGGGGGGGDGSSSSQLSAKKQARMLKKQSKLAAEYRLVTGKDEGEVSSPKKMKLNGGEGQQQEAKETLDPEQFKAMKLELAERKRALMHLPRFTVNQSVGYAASVFKTEYSTRSPLLFSDIQHLVTYAYGGNTLVPPPSRWCQLQKPNRLVQVVVLIVDGVGLNEFVDNEDCFSRSMAIFGGEDDKNKGILEFLSPHWYGGSVEDEMLRWGFLGGRSPVEEPSENLFPKVVSQIGSVFPIEQGIKLEETDQTGATEQPTDTFPRTSLVLTLPQLIQEWYPLPIPANAIARDFVTYTPTRDSYKPVNASSKMFALDCEMCSTTTEPNALTRIGIVDEDLNIVYQSLVKPKDKITDYRTRWSGITKEMLENIDVSVADVQAKIRELVNTHPDCILVGQSLNCDLVAIRMTHPYVIDTSVVFNLTGVEGRKSKLKDLAYNLLGEEIQKNDTKKHKDAVPQGHCPVEDATACMKLVKMKLSNGFSFGNELKNVNVHNTVMSLDQSFLPKKNNQMDKDVVLITKEIQETETTTTSLDQTKLKTKTAPTNKQIVKQMIEHCLTNFLTIGFYKIDPEMAAADTPKMLKKLDKRMARLFDHVSANSLFVVVCSNGKGEAEAGPRRNNGVCFVRLRSGEVAAAKRRTE